MPSHRKQRVPRHRAQRRIKDPSRLAALNAVLAAPKLAPEALQRAPETALQALSAPAPERVEAVPAQEVPEATLIGPFLGGAASGPAAAGRWSARTGHRVSGQRVYSAVRGLLVTPWFAASTGFVVAAGMWLYSPHARINFPPAIGKVHCQSRDCV